MLNGLTEGDCEVLELDLVVVEIDSLVRSLSLLLSSATALDSEVGQQIDIVFAHGGNHLADHLLELAGSDHLTHVLTLFVTKSRIDLICHILEVLLALVKQFCATLELSRGDDPL